MVVLCLPCPLLVAEYKRKLPSIQIFHILEILQAGQSLQVRQQLFLQIEDQKNPNYLSGLKGWWKRWNGSCMVGLCLVSIGNVLMSWWFVFMFACLDGLATNHLFMPSLFSLAEVDNLDCWNSPVWNITICPLRQSYYCLNHFIKRCVSLQDHKSSSYHCRIGC